MAEHEASVSNSLSLRSQAMKCLWETIRVVDDSAIWIVLEHSELAKKDGVIQVAELLATEITCVRATNRHDRGDYYTRPTWESKTWQQERRYPLWRWNPDPLPCSINSEGFPQDMWSNSLQCHWIKIEPIDPVTIQFVLAEGECVHGPGVIRVAEVLCSDVRRIVAKDENGNGSTYTWRPSKPTRDGVDIYSRKFGRFGKWTCQEVEILPDAIATEPRRASDQPRQEPEQ